MNELPTKESQVTHLKNMMTTPGWAILVYHLNMEREAIIREGKNARADEKQRKMWAALDGFDKACLMAERLVKANTAITDAIDPLEEENA